MTDRLLLDAARILEREADVLRRSYQANGEWLESGDERTEHDEMLEVARQLRARAKEAK